MVKRFRKKPVIIEAIQFIGINQLEITQWSNGYVQPDLNLSYRPVKETGKLVVRTLEGTMTADIGDFIIKGIKGELYPCKPDIFAQTYEEA